MGFKHVSIQNEQSIRTFYRNPLTTNPVPVSQHPERRHCNYNSQHNPGTHSSGTENIQAIWIWITAYNQSVENAGVAFVKRADE